MYTLHLNGQTAKPADIIPTSHEGNQISIFCFGARNLYPENGPVNTQIILTQAEAKNLINEIQVAMRVAARKVEDNEKATV
jgi:hypothetical protein